MTNETGEAGQSWSPDSYDENVRFVSDLGAGVLGWLDPGPGEDILDLGCGDGVLTRRIAEAGANVSGVDSSPDFVAAARASGLSVDFMDGHELEFREAFDAVFSNAALHWMTRPREVAAGVFRALRPGGRFVGEFGGFGNVAAIVTALRSAAIRHDGEPELANPWYFPTPAEYGAVLTEAGFELVRHEHFYRLTPLPTGIRGWLAVFRAPFFEQFGAKAGTVLDEVVEALRFSLFDESGQWYADYVRLRFEAIKSA